MLCTDIIVVELARLFEGQFYDPLGARRKDHLLLNGLAPAPDDRFDLLAHLREVDAERFEHFGGQALALGNNAEQNVLRSDIIVSETLRLFLSEHDAAPRSLGEWLPHRHRSGFPFLSPKTLPVPEQFRDPSTTLEGSTPACAEVCCEGRVTPTPCLR